MVALIRYIFKYSAAKPVKEKYWRVSVLIKCFYLVSIAFCLIPNFVHATALEIPVIRDDCQSLERCIKKIWTNERVEHIFKFGAEYIVLTSTSLNGLNKSGVIYKVFFRDGIWEVMQWRSLPSVPLQAGLVNEYELFVETENGSVLLTRSGDFRMAECEGE